MFAYLPYSREYGLRVLDLSKPVDRQPILIRTMPYCPFCGRKHPEPLREAWEERMRAEGLDPKRPVWPNSDHLPKKLNSDQWWREAGL